MEKNIKLVLLDSDNTLCNSSEAYDIALSKSYEFFKMKSPLINAELFYDRYNKARKQIRKELEGTASMHNRALYFQRMFELLGLTFDAVLIDELLEVFWSEVYKNLKLHLHVEETLKAIKNKDIKVIIVSNLLISLLLKRIKKLDIT